MAGLKNIKLKISSVGKTRKVTRAMEAVSAVKMRKTQERALLGRPYATAAISILHSLAGGIDAANHPLMQKRDGKAALIVITSDKGLAGSLNSNVLRAAEEVIKEHHLNKNEIVIYAIGRRGADYFANRGYDVRERHENVADDVPVAELRTATDAILAWHNAGEIGRCYIVYTNFLSTFEQKPIVRRVIPLAPVALKEMVEGIPPVKGKYSNGKIIDKTPIYTIEPNAEEVFNVLLPDLIHIIVFHALLEAKASEHSARMVAMKNATDKARDVGKMLTLKYNKARQAAITREVSEITSGIEAMR
ncbi:ATP synthase F1 subunit gamma [Candidatus Kaiserbacteria bacterium]|nr:ATP synthase F1 subunit gamma [Candidatus Kaiserbacteria bacterium]